MLDLLKGGPKLGDEAQQLLAALEAEIKQHKRDPWEAKTGSWASVKAVTQASPEAATELMLHALAVLGKPTPVFTEKTYLKHKVFKEVVKRAAKHELSQEDARRYAKALRAMAREDQPSATMVAALERALTAYPDDPEIRGPATELVQEVLVTEYGPPTAVQQRLATRLQQALGGAFSSSLPLPESGDPFGDAARKELEALPADELARWQPLLALAAGAKASKPSKKFLNAAGEAVQAIGEAAFVSAVRPWFETVKPPERRLGWGERTLTVANADLLCGLVWACATALHPEKLTLLADLAHRSLKKIPGHGPVCRKVGNACLLVMSLDGSRDAVAQLQVVLQRCRYLKVRSLIEKFLDEAAERAGMTRGDLDDVAIPSFGLDPSGEASVAVGDHTALLRLAGLHEVELSWRKPDGKTAKTPPKALREAHPDAVKELKARVKQIKQQMTAQRDRIEGFWIAGREWSLGELRERFLDHPFMAFFGRRLIWIGSADGGKSWTAFTCAEGTPHDLRGEALELEPEARVRLWHPLLCDPETVLAWRRRLAEQGITQPVKQAHREVYVVTDAELETDTYSNRFAAHILKQHQLQALGQSRGWSYQLQGSFDGYNAPTRRVPEHDLVVEFIVEPILEGEAMAGSGIALYVSTDQVRFRPEEGEPLRLRGLPPLLFSEIMREVDLFVGVASVGNDPNWVDGGEGWVNAEYWNDFAFGELSATAQTRREVLAELLPSLKIESQCTLEDRFLHVRGKLARYRIHLGSGNIQVEPGNRYLCIVRAPQRQKGPAVQLPFDGDGTLSVILSKAILLANDDKILDPQILGQIK